MLASVQWAATIITSTPMSMAGCRLNAEQLLKQAKLIQKYGADGVMLMDSAGSSLWDEVADKVGLLFENLDIKVGFHAHNNLGMAVVNSSDAVESGADFIDCTSLGLGAGAGNCQLEVLVAVLHKLGYETGLDLYKLMDNAEITAKIMKEHISCLLLKALSQSRTYPLILE